MYQEGYSIDQGYLSPYFLKDQKKDKKIEFENNVYVIVIDDTVSSSRDIVRFLEFAKKTQG